MALWIIGEFQARPGQEREVEAAIEAVVPASRAESACLFIHAFRSNRDPARFFIHSHWTDEDAFEAHAGLPHTVRFLATVAPLLTHAVDVARLSRIA